MYVANAANGAAGSVSVFAPGHTTPLRTLIGVNSPVALAVDANNTIYVANAGNNTISVFQLGHTTPSYTLTGVKDPTALALDAQGDLFVAESGSNTVAEYARGHTMPTALLTGVQQPSALAIDAHGYVYVANDDQNAGAYLGNGSTISVFAPGQTTPLRMLTVPSDSVPSALVFDKQGDLFVADNHSVREFAAPAPTGGGIVILPSLPSEAIALGSGPGSTAGLTLTNAELARLQIGAGGTLTFGSAAQTGTIAFQTAPFTVPSGSTIAAVEAVNGPGSIVFNNQGARAALVDTGNLSLTAGTGGMVAVQPTSKVAAIAATGTVTLTTAGALFAHGGLATADSLTLAAGTGIGALNGAAH